MIWRTETFGERSSSGVGFRGQAPAAAPYLGPSSASAAALSSGLDNFYPISKIVEDDGGYIVLSMVEYERFSNKF